MNLHGVVRGMIQAVNPDIPVSVETSSGYTTLDDGSRVPTYNPAITVHGQVQSLTYRDLAQLEGLNLNGTRRAIYLYDRYDGVVRSQVKGGDLITVGCGVNAGVWLVAQVLEQWPDWVKVAVTLQNENP